VCFFVLPFFYGYEQFTASRVANTGLRDKVLEHG